jgi:small basic protein (TIGR04137 family)
LPDPQAIEVNRPYLGPFELKTARTSVRCRLHFRRKGKNMSQHRSLKGASTIAAKRNVLKRFERVELLKKRGQWKDGSKVLGLPKTKPDL